MALFRALKCKDNNIFKITLYHIDVLGFRNLMLLIDVLALGGILGVNIWIDHYKLGSKQTPYHCILRLSDNLIL